MKQENLDILKSGGVGVLATDTIYGLAGQALNPKTVERMYQLRKRKPDKPFIILIGELDDLNLFDVDIDLKSKQALEKYWPGQVSIILPCQSKKFKYLHRGINSLAFRLPNKEELIKVLEQTGPLAAPSANPEGEKPAKNIQEAKNYFGEGVDFYEDEGDLESLASTLIKVTDGEIEILRKGENKI